MDSKMLFQRDNVSLFAHNTKLVSPQDAPKKWEDLLDPKWQGRIAVARDGGGGWSGSCQLWAKKDS